MGKSFLRTHYLLLRFLQRNPLSGMMRGKMLYIYCVRSARTSYNSNEDCM